MESVVIKNGTGSGNTANVVVAVALRSHFIKDL